MASLPKKPKKKKATPAEVAADKKKLMDELKAVPDPPKKKKSDTEKLYNELKKVKPKWMKKK